MVRKKNYTNKNIEFSRMLQGSFYEEFDVKIPYFYVFHIIIIIQLEPSE